MRPAPPIFALFAVIILEGYVVLASELLAIRQTIPYVGSGSDTVSIIIAAVLMPLAFGYYAGGRFKPGFVNGKYRSVRKRLVHNMLISLVIYVIGLSYPVIRWFFSGMIELGIDNRLVLITIYSMLFMVTPVYLLGQTIPLITNYFSKEKLSQVTGRILFFSTVGSFLGAVFSTLVLMSTIGVHYTTVVLFVVLALLIFLLNKKKTEDVVIAAVGLAIAGFFLNSGDLMRAYNIVENNRYNTIKVYETEDGTRRHLSLNNNASSMFGDNGEKYKYLEFIEKLAIETIPYSEDQKNILVIGAGGFTFGYNDIYNHYDFIDIDGSLQSIAEEHLLKEPLSDNKHFHPMPARGFLAKTDMMYDVVLIDVFQGDLNIPEHLITRDFFEQLKGKMNDGGVLFSNFIMSPNFKSRYSRIVDNTWRSVFPHSSRHVMRERYLVWNDAPETNANIIYIYRKYADEDCDTIYTDNKNTAFIDKPGGMLGCISDFK